MRKVLISILAGAVLVSGCATASRGQGASYEPIIDFRPGQTQEQYVADLAACQQHATKIADAQRAAVAGAIAGALLGAALGAAAGGNSRQNMRMAGVGAVSGSIGAGAEAEGGQRGIVTRCMLGRGYMVLL